MSALTPLRHCCEALLCEELFTDFQDKAFLRDVVLASKDARFWIFIVAVSIWVMQPLERIRRWGLICGHAECNQKPKDGAKHVKCPANGRRLPEVWEEIQKRIAEFRRWARTVRATDCEGHQQVWECVQGMCKLCASELHLHFKHYGIVPWALSTAKTVAGAADCVK